MAHVISSLATFQGVVSQEVLDELEACAVEASQRSHNPYSHFPVGAALLCGDGSVVPGTNIESASFSLTTCAERCALHTAVGLGYHSFVALAVVCPQATGTDPALRMCCGGCRQVISEFLPPDALVRVGGVGTFTVAELLPLAFHL